MPIELMNRLELIRLGEETQRQRTEAFWHWGNVWRRLGILALGMYMGAAIAVAVML
jgi:hypothetical protein